MSRIVFDHAATTPIDERVIEVMMETMRRFPGNPSSIHHEGRAARTAIEAARKTIAGLLNASIGEIFFTSGGTESNNMALKGAVRDLGVRRIISTPTEHHAVLHSVDRLALEQAVETVHVRQDARGHVDTEHLRSLLEASGKPTLVSLMHANNEIGTMIDLEEIAELCAAYGAWFHSDTVQTMGYFPIDLSRTRISFLTAAAHKFHGPKGVGFIYINSDNQIRPFIDGGAQERNMRGGTENIYGIVGMAKALELAYAEMAARRQAIEEVKHYLAEQLQRHFPEVEFNGDPFGRAHYKVLSVSFPPSPKAEMLLLNLDIQGVSVSGGSACSSGADAGSHVIAALDPDSDRTTIRFSFAHTNTLAEVDSLIAKLKGILG